MQRAPDRMLAEKARADNRILLTFDVDFGAILVLGVIDRRACPHSIDDRVDLAYAPEIIDHRSQGET